MPYRLATPQYETCVGMLPTDFYSTTVMQIYQAFFGIFDKKISFRAKKIFLCRFAIEYDYDKR